MSMERGIRITAGAVAAVAQLNDSKTARAIWDALPIEAKGSTWGDEIYFDIGVTAAPEAAREVVDLGDLAYWPLGQEICSIVPGDVSLEVVATDFEGMVKEGEELAQVAPNAVVKCPLTKDGLKAVKYLSGKGIRVNQTLCFSATQALLSAKAGAVYISPFLGRLDDIAHVGMDLVRDICEIYRVQGFKTQVLAASIRNPLHVIDAAKAGAHVVTMPFAVLEQLMKHPLTDIGLKKFLEDWAKLGEKI